MVYQRLEEGVGDLVTVSYVAVKEISSVVLLCSRFKCAVRKDFECFYHKEVIFEVILQGYLDLALYNVHTYQNIL